MLWDLILLNYTIFSLNNQTKLDIKVLFYVILAFLLHITEFQLEQIVPNFFKVLLYIVPTLMLVNLINFLWQVMLSSAALLSILVNCRLELRAIYEHSYILYRFWPHWLRKRVIYFIFGLQSRKILTLSFRVIRRKPQVF